MKRLSFLLLFSLFCPLAQAQSNVTPQGNAPAAPATETIAPGTLVQDVYQFALIIGGLLAFGAIVFGAIKYTLAAGNPTGQHEGKEWITQALLGLLLLVGAALILGTINPRLRVLELPNELFVKLQSTTDNNTCPPPKVWVRSGGSEPVCTNPPSFSGSCDPIGNKGCTPDKPRCVIVSQGASQPFGTPAKYQCVK